MEVVLAAGVTGVFALIGTYFTIRRPMKRDHADIDTRLGENDGTTVFQYLTRIDETVNRVDARTHINAKRIDRLDERVDAITEERNIR